MKGRKIIAVILAVVMMLGIANLPIGASVVRADGDTTAPTVDRISFTGGEYNKGDTIELTLDITEEGGMGVSRIGICFYCVKNGQVLIVSQYNSYGITDDEDPDNDVALQTGTHKINFTIPQDAVASEYYVGQIDIEDQAGNFRMYFNGYNGYSVDDGGSYVTASRDETHKCYIDGGNTFTIPSSGDDFAPVVTNVTFDQTVADKGDTVTFTLDVEEESEIAGVTLTLYFDKNNQTILLGTIGNDFVVNDNGTVTCTIDVSEDSSAGSYYLGQIDIYDNYGNTRQYYNYWDPDGYIIDDNGKSYIKDIYNEEVKAYIANGDTLTINSDGDDTAPTISKVTIDKDQIIKPGVVKLTFSANDENKIKDIIVTMYTINEGNEVFLYGYAYGVNTPSGDIDVTIPVPTNTVCGKYYIGQVDISDSSGNSRMYYNQWSPTGYDVDSTGYYVKDNYSDEKFYVENGASVDIEEEFDVGFEMALSNADLLEPGKGIDALQDGETGKVLIDSDNIAEKEIFDAIKGRNVNIVFFKDNYQWIFNGQDIGDTKDIDLSVSFEKVSGDDYGLESEALLIKFADNGALPGKAKIRIKSDYTYEIYQVNKDVELYYVDKTKGLEYEEDSEINYVPDGDDHWFWFEITHNSNYLATSSKINQNINPNNNPNNNSNNNQNKKSGSKSGSNSKPGAKSNNTGTGAKKTTSAKKYSNEWIKGKWYNKDGSQTYKGTLSWKCNSTGWWVEDSAGWYPQSQWQKIDGVWYYFKSSGYMASSEYYDGYWFNSDGSWDSKYYLSWKCNSTGWWVEDKSGWWPANKWLKVDGDWYYFNGSGYMATSQYVDGWWVGANGVCQ